MSVTGTKSYDDNGTQKNITTTADYDGWGRVIHQTNRNGGQVNTAYDAMGRVASVTNPFPIGGSPGPATSYGYDALGRTTVVTLPDTQTVQTNYNGASVTNIDQVNRKIQRLTDGLGRLVTVNEQDGSGLMTVATNYSYDALGNLTQVNQGNQLRSYKYDAMSRMTNEKIPEQGDPTQSNQWTTSYTYTSFNAVATRTDARGVITSYAYDTLNRISQVSYNTVSGVTTAPAVTYIYDTDPIYGTTKDGAVVRLNVGSDYQERYTFDQYMRMSSTIRTIGAQTYTTTNQYNQANQPLQNAFGSFAYDSAGRLSSIATAGNVGMSGITYNVAGQLTGDTLTSSGLYNGYLINSSTVETFGYDTYRMQMTSQTAVTTNTTGSCVPPPCPPPPPGGTNLNLNYYYQASAGQMGVGTTAGNAGQLMAINSNSTIGGLAESASYTYDNYGRLATSSQTSNGSSAQRRFADDRWGNRSGLWDAVSGGNQIQSIALQTVSFPGTGTAPTNRITSVTSGSTLNYTYDANGNVTSDGVQTYKYDSENRLVKSIGGVTATYLYDHQNRRYKKTIGSSVRHYVWEGMQVICEYNGSTGALLIQYGYAGSRMISKSASGTTQYFLSDRLSIRLAFSDIGVVAGRQGHLPFGEDFGGSGNQEKHHYTNYEFDAESGLDYAINRSYSRNLGRFQQADPYKPSGFIVDPQSWNRYAYSRNNPIDFSDPYGLLLAFVSLGSLNFISISAGAGWISADSPGFELFWSYLTGGGSGADGSNGGDAGGGTDSGQQPQRRIFLGQAVEAFFHNNQDCEQAIDTALNEKFSGMKGDFQEILWRTDFQDYRDHANQTLAELKLAPTDINPGAAWAPYTTTAGMALGIGGIATALTSLEAHIVYLGELYYATGDFSGKGFVLVHETLHVAFGNHVSVANALHVKNNEGKDFQPGEEDAALGALNSWLTNDCHQ